MGDVPNPVKVYPGEDAVDYLITCRLLSIEPKYDHLLGLADVLPVQPPVILEDIEGVPLIDWGTDAHQWLAQASSRPFAHLLADPAEQFATTIAIDDLLSRDLVDTLLRSDGPQRLLVTAASTPGKTTAGAEAVIRASIAALDGTQAVVRAVPVPRHAPVEWRQEVLARLHATAATDNGHPDEAVARAAVGGRPRRGAVVLFTGLSGSGKSTVARAVRDRIVESGTRPVTLLDGDAVRRHLSAGLGFSAADRETNIERIGWVAAQIAAHGGLAIASPIAPFERTRSKVAAMAASSDADFILIHISTPLSECERRDRKGLYARARAGEIPEFTGISSPYETPETPDLRIDTTDIDVASAVDQVLEFLTVKGHL